MSNVLIGWIKDKLGRKTAPLTLASCVFMDDGTSVADRLSNLLLKPLQVNFLINCETRDVHAYRFGNIVFVDGIVRKSNSTDVFGTNAQLLTLPYKAISNTHVPMAVYTSAGNSVATGELTLDANTNILKISCASNLYAKFNFWYATSDPI